MITVNSGVINICFEKPISALIDILLGCIFKSAISALKHTTF